LQLDPPDLHLSSAKFLNMHKFSEDWRGADAWEGLEKLDELDGEKLDDREEKLDELGGEKLLDREKEDDEEGEKLDR
jgi:hypothetical protein